MPSRPDTSEVSQDEVEALFGTDGEPQEEPEAVEENSGEEESEDSEPEEGTEEPEAEEQESSEGEEAEEESEEEEAEEEPGELDWSEVDPRYQEAFKSQQAEAHKWKKDYGKLQSKFTERGKAFQQEERTLSVLRAKAETVEQWENLLEQHPQLQQLIEREVSRIRDPLAAMPKELAQDPAIQYMQPVIRSLQQKVEAYERKLGKIDAFESREVEAQNRAKLDGFLGETGSKFKAMFGKEAGEAEMAQVLKYMVDNGHFSGGKIALSPRAALLEVFGDQYEKAIQSRQASQMRTKAKKFPARGKSVNPSRVGKASQDATTPEEAIARALADQGYGT